jgi:hypothetical protein
MDTDDRLMVATLLVLSVAILLLAAALVLIAWAIAQSFAI